MFYKTNTPEFIFLCTLLFGCHFNKQIPVKTGNIINLCVFVRMLYKVQRKAYRSKMKLDCINKAKLKKTKTN